MGKQIASVVLLQLSGSEKNYTYIYDPVGIYPDIGTRAVVPNKLKDDGTLSLAIGTVVDVIEVYELHPSITYKHVITFLDPLAIERATQQLKGLVRA